MMILSILATVVLLGALFYHRVSLFISSLILLAWTAALGVAGLWSAWVLVPLAIILVPFNFAPMRKSMISAPVFRGFRKVMPPMSRTEKEAINAGTTWWEGDLFQGKPDWKKLHNYPQPRLTAEEQAFLDGPVEAIEPGPVEGIRATGANKLEEILYGVLPQVMPLLISYSLYRFESNVRSATVVGMVGAGGIGVTLWEAIRGFQFQQTCALMVLIIVTVSLLDFLSQRLRKHFI